MLRKSCIYIFFLFFGALHAELTDPNVQAVTEGDPSSTICDCVNLLTGDFVASAEDIVIQGAEPLHIQRSYVSGVGGCWEFFPHVRLKLIPKKIRKEKGVLKGKDFRRISVCEPNGTQLIFKREAKIDVSEAWVPYTIDFEKHGKGITNVSRGEISGRNNLKNHLLYQETETKITLHCADGTKRYYRGPHGNKEPVFLLRYELLPSGNKIHYRYDKHGRLNHVYTTNGANSKTYAWCRIHREDREITFETSDGRHLCYTHTSRGYLSQVSGPELPEETITYAPVKKSSHRLLKKRSLPEGREISVEYYEGHTDYQIEDNHLRVHGSSDPRNNRVKTLYLPLGEDGERIATHHFLYNISREIDSDGDYIYTNDGITDVYDADGNRTTLHFSPRFLPYKIDYYEKENLHHTVEMIWEQDGWLKQKIIRDNAGSPLLTRSLFYDEKGNPLKETLSGNICDKNTCDTQTTLSSYTEKNLLKERTSPSGLTTRYTYLNGSYLVEKKFLLNKNNMILREFYTYNEDRILVCHITDDGIGEELDDLTGVTERKIQRIHPKEEAPAQNLPEIIEEKALDLTTHEEILIRKLHLHYSEQGHIVQTDIYDAADTFSHSIIRNYDSHGHPISIDSPEGTTTYSYDLNGNPIEETTPSGKNILRSYDYANRLIREIETSPNSDPHENTNSYNHLNHKISSTDHFGNITHFSYDRFGHLTKMTHSDHAEEQFSYNIQGYQTSHTDASGYTTYTSYNVLGQPLSINYPDNTQEHFTYTIDGKCLTHTDQEGHTTTHSYDALGREIHTQHPDGTEEYFFYNAFHLLAHTDRAGILTTYNYDFAGRKITEKRDQQLTSYTYDSMGRIYKEIHHNEANTLVHVFIYNSKNEVIEERQENQFEHVLQKAIYEYDTQGNRIVITRENTTERFVYDCFNRLISHENAEGYTTLIAYDEQHLNNNQEKTLRSITTDPLGFRTIETCDTRGRVIKKEIYSPNAEQLFSEAYNYDLSGNCADLYCYVHEANIHTRTLHTHKAYDSMNRLILLEEAVNTPDSKTTYFSYTSKGKLQQTQKPNGITLDYIYDTNDNLIELFSSDQTIHYTNTYDPLGNLLSSYDHTTHTTTTRSFDTLNNLLSETLANGLTLHNTYDAASRRVKLQLPHKKTITYTYNPLHLTNVNAYDQTFTYTYDALGNLTQLNDTSYRYDKLHRKTHLYAPHFNQVLQYDPHDNIVETLKEDTLHTYHYDGLDQLIKEPNHTYRYDSYNNRLAKDDIPYTVNALHALTQAANTQYIYDPCGNPIKKVTPTAIHLYTYDALDRLTSVTEENRWRICFAYDGLHRRLSKTLFLYENETWIKKIYLPLPL